MGRKIFSLDCIMSVLMVILKFFTRVQMTKFPGNFMAGVLKTFCFLRSRMRVVFEKVVF